MANHRAKWPCISEDHKYVHYIHNINNKIVRFDIVLGSTEYNTASISRLIIINDIKSYNNT